MSASLSVMAALVALEQETAWSQESNNTAMRVVATKLLAQHDASVSTVLAELEDTEAVIADVQLIQADCKRKNP